MTSYQRQSISHNERLRSVSKRTFGPPQCQIECQEVPVREGVPATVMSPLVLCHLRTVHSDQGTKKTREPTSSTDRICMGLTELSWGRARTIATDPRSP